MKNDLALRREMWSMLIPMLNRHIAWVGFVALTLLSACSPSKSSSDPAKDAVAPAAAIERFDSASIDRAKKLIEAEPKVIDFSFDPSNAIEWHVAVKNDGGRRYGYAGYLCQLLRDAGAYDDETDVRIVDAARAAQMKDAYRDYSLGAVRCRDDQHLD